MPHSRIFYLFLTTFSGRHLVLMGESMYLLWALTGRKSLDVWMFSRKLTSYFPFVEGEMRLGTYWILSFVSVVKCWCQKCIFKEYAVSFSDCCHLYFFWCDFCLQRQRWKIGFIAKAETAVWQMGTTYWVLQWSMYDSSHFQLQH